MGREGEGSIKYEHWPMFCFCDKQQGFTEQILPTPMLARAIIELELTCSMHNSNSNVLPL